MIYRKPPTTTVKPITTAAQTTANCKKEQTRVLLAQASVKAIRSLLQLMDDRFVDHAVRCNAAFRIFELHFKGCELAEVEESINELRAILQDGGPSSKGLRAV